ncbi:MAG: hypothetical protein JF603_07155 [Acidobacteria bacterium]|nr:hypothetical protein [Acidobacteriota bacterium]
MNHHRLRNIGAPRVRRLVAMAFVPLALGTLVATAGPASASAPTVTVFSNAPMLDSGVAVNGTANIVTLTATGTWDIGGINVLGANYGPGGSSTGHDEPWCTLAPTATMGSLVGTLDGGVTWFAVGTGPTVVTGTGSLGFAANDCAPSDGDGPHDFGYFGDNSGSVTVTITSTPRLPTQGSQCKSNGWRSYGVFKNQGDCVSFVATGGRNTPAG